MKSSNEKGVITVFLALILPAVLLSGMILTDAAILRTGMDMADQAVRSSALSILGQYSSYLKEEYGIYGFCLNEMEAEETVHKIITESLGGPGFYDFAIEDLQIVFTDSLAQPGVLKEAVLLAASDELYKNVIEGFIDKFNIFNGFSGAADVINLKMKVDEAVRRFREAGEFLTDLVNGDGKVEYYINSISNFTDLDIDADKLSEIIHNMEELKYEIEELKKTIDEVESENAGKLNLMEEALGVLRETAADLYYSEMEEILSGLLQTNSKAMEYIKTMVAEKVNINILSQLINKKINESEDLPEYMKEILMTVSDVIRDVENEAVGLIFEDIEDKINENISVLFRSIVYIESEIDGTVTEENLPGSISETLDGYRAGVVFSFKKSGSAGTDDDRRGFFEELGKRVLEKRTGKDVEISKAEILPSIVYGESQNESSFDVEASGESTGSAEDGMTRFSKDTSNLKFILETLCIDEYLLNNLTMETSEQEPVHIFKNEIEYILWGAKSQNLNRFYTKSALMGTRFALNAIHVYTDSSKKIKADAIAAATAGWWTMGAGIPVMSNLVRCAWAIAESGFDVERLCDGGSVAIVKRKADWVTDIGIEGAGLDSPDFLCMNYEDYLRIYLLMCGDVKKMARLADLIQLNATGNFDIFNSYTGVTIKAVISFRSLTGKRHEVPIEINSQYQRNSVS
ncbi:MAG: hypothetical protein JW903_03830 [Clostridia bacterium]|nr:hypothetical protein [Clostridia bacterium]